MRCCLGDAPHQDPLGPSPLLTQASAPAWPTVGSVFLGSQAGRHQGLWERAAPLPSWGRLGLPGRGPRISRRPPDCLQDGGCLPAVHRLCHTPVPRVCQPVTALTAPSCRPSISMPITRSSLALRSLLGCSRERPEERVLLTEVGRAGLAPHEGHPAKPRDPWSHS